MLKHQEERYLKKLLKENKHQSAVLHYLRHAMKGVYKILIGKKSVFILSQGSFQKDSSPKTYAYLIDENGRKALTRSGYKKIFLHADKYNMFIDGCSMQCTKKLSRIDPPVRNTLNQTGFALLKEYINNPQPVSLALIHTKIPAYLKKYEVTALKYFQEARSLVDFRESRYRWKCFKKISGKGENTVFQFIPPVGYKYCLIIPVNWD